MATLPQIEIDGDDWVSINNITGVAVGTAMNIINLSLISAIIQEASSKPNINSFYGKPLRNLNTNYAEIFISEGSDEIWARASLSDKKVWLCCST